MARPTDRLVVRDLELPNRLVAAPLALFPATDGQLAAAAAAHYAMLALGGVGTVLVEQLAVSVDGRGSVVGAGLYKEAHAKALGALLEQLEQRGAVGGVQIGHAGRLGSLAEPWGTPRYVTEADGGFRPVAPSPEPLGELEPPRELAKKELAGVVQAFAKAAGRARAAGARIVELAGAQGQLVHQFLSPVTNHRRDDYGGSMLNRARFSVELAQAVRGALGEGVVFAVSVPLGDGVEGGWDFADTVQLGKLLKSEGVDLLTLAPLGIDGRTRVAEAARVADAAAELADRVRLPVNAVGAAASWSDVEAQLARDPGPALLSLGRLLLADPFAPRRLAAAAGGPLPWPQPYAALGLATS